MVIKVVSGVDGKEDGDDGGMLKAVWMPIKIMITSGDGVERGAKGGDMNQIPNRPVLLETPENIIVRLVSVQVDGNDGSGSTHTVAGNSPASD